MELTCEWCGNKFFRYMCNIKKHNFCCVECSRAWQRENNPKGKDHPQYNRIEVKCFNCGKVKEKPRFKARGKKQFCDVKCRNEYKKNNPEPLKAQKVNCGWCGKEMILPPSRIKKASAVFCQMKCRSEWYSKNYCGQNSPQYINGESDKVKRGRKWPDISRAIRARDGEKCVCCGEARKLAVHHIVPVYEWEDPNEANRHWNLVTLCPSCHAKVTGSEGIMPDGEQWDKVRDYMDQYEVSMSLETLVLPRAEITSRII